MSELNEQKAQILPCRLTGRNWKWIFVVCGYKYNHRNIPIELSTLCRDNLQLYIRISIFYWNMVLILFFVMFVGILVSLSWLLLFVLVKYTAEMLADVGIFLPFHVRCRDSFCMCWTVSTLIPVKCCRLCCCGAVGLCHHVASSLWSTNSCICHFLLFISHVYRLECPRADSAGRQQDRNLTSHVTWKYKYNA